MKVKLGWVVAAILAIGIVYVEWGGHDDSLLAAVARGAVSVTISADGPDRAHLTVTRSGGSGDLVLVLPAGSVISSGDDHTQRLMTAAKVEIRLAAAQSTTQIDVETYCLDQFKAPPPTAASMNLPSPQDESTGEKDENAKLADCLLTDQAPLRRRQVALWLVKGGYLDRRYDDATADATRQFEEELSRELQDKMSTEFVDRLRKAAPGISDAEVQRQVARFTPDRLRARVHGKAVGMTNGTFGHVKADAAELLQKCGYPVATALLFQTAPDA